MCRATQPKFVVLRRSKAFSCLGREGSVLKWVNTLTTPRVSSRIFAPWILFEIISLYEKGSGAKLNRSKLEAMWVGAWKSRDDQPFGLTWVKKMKILGVFFGVVDVQRDNWEPKLSKLDRMLSMWKSRSLSMIGKSLVINVLGVSKLLYLARVLVTPRWLLSVIILLFGSSSGVPRLSLWPVRPSTVPLSREVSRLLTLRLRVGHYVSLLCCR